MTDQQRELLSKAMDLKIEWRDAYNLANQKKAEYDAVMEDLERSMGKNEFDKFMTMGRRMFAPKED